MNVTATDTVDLIEEIKLSVGSQAPFKFVSVHLLLP